MRLSSVRSDAERQLESGQQPSGKERPMTDEDGHVSSPNRREFLALAHDMVSNNSGNETFEEVVAARLSRRGFLGGSLDGGRGVAGRRRLAAQGGPGVRKVTAGPCSASRASRSRAKTRSSCRRATPPRCSSPGATRCRTGRRSGRTPATAPPTRRSSGACTTTASCTSRSTARGTACSCRTTSTPTTCCCSRTAPPTGTQEKTDKSLNAHGVSIIEISKQAQGTTGAGRMVTKARR